MCARWIQVSPGRQAGIDIARQDELDLKGCFDEGSARGARVRFQSMKGRG